MPLPGQHLLLGELAQAPPAGESLPNLAPSAQASLSHAEELLSAAGDLPAST